MSIYEIKEQLMRQQKRENVLKEIERLYKQGSIDQKDYLLLTGLIKKI